MSVECKVRKLLGGSGASICLLFSKNAKGTAMLNVPIRQMNHYQWYICTAFKSENLDLTQVYYEQKLTI